MGRQLRFYLLPSDVDRMIDDLRANLGIRLYLAKAPTAKLVEVTDGTLSRSETFPRGRTHYVRTYIASPTYARISSNFIDKQGYWLIDTDSEAIEFDGSDFGPSALFPGRLYYQADFLRSDGKAIVPKRKEFVRWAEHVFRRTKKTLTYSPDLGAYLGPDTMKWRDKGGKLSDRFRSF